MADKRLDIYQDAGARRAFAMHARVWQNNRYVYAVVSRRSRGISIGVNLNPDKVCNFDCIYCCVDRTTPGQYKDVDLDVLRAELAQMLDLVRSGEIFHFDPFDKIPHDLRRINDVAFSGNGEPTSCPNFLGACKLAAELVEGIDAETRRHGNAATTVEENQKSKIENRESHEPVKLVVITNATLFHQKRVREVLAFLDRHNGEIWAKLDAGTEPYYKLVERTTIPFRRVLENILWCCRERPTVIQALFMQVHGVPPPEAEIDAFVQRLAEIAAAGGHIKLVQIYTVARHTAEPFATALSEAQLQAIAKKVRARLPELPTEVYA